MSKSLPFTILTLQILGINGSRRHPKSIFIQRMIFIFYSFIKMDSRPLMGKIHGFQKKFHFNDCQQSYSQFL